MNEWKRQIGPRNFEDSRPSTTPMKSTGMKKAASDQIIDTIVKPISHQTSDDVSGSSPISKWTIDVLQHNDRIVHDEGPTERISAIIERLSRL